MSFLRLIDEIKELLYKDFPYAKVKYYNNEYDIYFNDKYIGVSFKDGNKGLTEEFYAILKKEIEYNKHRKMDTHSEDIKSVKIKEDRKPKNGNVKKPNSRSSDGRRSSKR